MTVPESGRDQPSPFPRRSGPTVRVDSVAEEYAYIAAYPGAGGPWEVVRQDLARLAEGPVDRLLVRAPAGDEAEVHFAVGSFFGTPGVTRLGGPTTELLDRLMRTAEEFARANGPHHPGSLPRFPVPSARYPGRVEVPLAVLAVDAGRRGLYAPPRVVTLDYASGEPFGVGEFPGFAPDAWPPARLGDWPPPAVAGFDRVRLQGAVSRLSACTTRLIDAWLAGDTYPHLPDDASEVLALLGVLDLPPTVRLYRQLNPAYVSWLEGAAG